MTTSRTGTTRWRTNRRTAIHRARSSGQTRCPHCGRTLLWDSHGLPASPEADHIIPHARGGTDDLENIQIICRHCNLKKGDGRHRKPPKKRRPPITKSTTQWDWPD